ncbi:hypothetical protein [Paenibacillus taichungensis]|uniref:hypothetical protein n=1 Tax=Paenibacillus taichungensis TaxID=484184 RepID=UPI0039A67802
MMIGGGAGEYVVTVESDVEIRNLIDSGQDEEDFTELTVGGQACEYPTTYLVNLEMVKMAIMEIFFETSAQLNWGIIVK